jgi:hypothetical protein
MLDTFTLFLFTLSTGATLVYFIKDMLDGYRNCN